MSLVGWGTETLEILPTVPTPTTGDRDPTSETRERRYCLLGGFRFESNISPRVSPGRRATVTRVVGVRGTETRVSLFLKTVPHQYQNQSVSQTRHFANHQTRIAKFIIIFIRSRMRSFQDLHQIAVALLLRGAVTLDAGSDIERRTGNIDPFRFSTHNPTRTNACGDIRVSGPNAHKTI